MIKDFLFRDELLDKSFEEAMAFSEDCERAFYKLGQRLGEWRPTRQYAFDAMRHACWVHEQTQQKTDRLWWAVGIEAAAIIGLFVILLVR